MAVPVTASDCLPLSYTAATENVYSVPLVSPVAVYSVVPAWTVACPSPGVQVMEYSLRFSLSGAVQLSVTLPSPACTAALVGAGVGYDASALSFLHDININAGNNSSKVLTLKNFFIDGKI